MQQAAPAADQPAPLGASSDAFLELVTHIISRFVQLPPHQVKPEINAALRQVLEYFGVDRCDFFRVDLKHRHVAVVGRAELDTVPSLPEVIDAGSQFPWLFEQVVMQGRLVNFNLQEQMPQEMRVDQSNLLKFEIRSVLMIPLCVAERVDYVIGIGSRRPMQVAPEKQQPRLKLLGEIFVSALQRMYLELARQEANRFDLLISRLSARFSGVWSDQLDPQINLALREVLEFAEVDQVGFFEVHADRNQAFLTHLAYSEGFVPASTEAEYATLFPWAYDRLVGHGLPVAFGSLEEVPAHATTDLAAWQALGVQSTFNLPFTIDGVVRYVLSMATNTRPRIWPSYFFERLHMLGDVFVSALGRKATIDALRGAERFSQATLNALHQYICVVDVEARVVQYSADWPHLYGLSEDVLGQVLHAAHPGLPGQSAEDAVRFQHGLGQVLAGENEDFMMESMLRHEPGTQWIQTRITRFNIGGRVYGAISHEDISLRKLGEQELESLRDRHWHADRVARTAVLISSLSHELSQPLTAILSNAQAGLRYLSRDSVDLEKLRDILSDIVADDKRAGEVIEALRTIMRRQKTERRVIHASGVLRDVLALLHSELVDQQIAVKVETEADSRVWADRAQLQQVILNLMINGIDAMRSKPALERLFKLAVWRADNGTVRISIEDSGVGVAPGDSEKLFDPFWSTKADGTGMGLPICRSIIESHDGMIWSESEPGVGSTFFISLPHATGVAEAQ